VPRGWGLVSSGYRKLGVGVKHHGTLMGQLTTKTISNKQTLTTENAIIQALSFCRRLSKVGRNSLRGTHNPSVPGSSPGGPTISCKVRGTKPSPPTPILAEAMIGIKFMVFAPQDREGKPHTHTDLVHYLIDVDFSPVPV